MKKILLLVLLSPILLFTAYEDPNPHADDLIDYGNHPLQNFELLLPNHHNQNTEVVMMIHGGGGQGKRMSVLLKNITTDYQLFMKITFYKL